MISWIGVDWGTTNLRAFAIDDNGLAMEEKSSPKGMSSLKPEEFEATLVELIDDWLDNERHCQTNLTSHWLMPNFYE